MFFNLRLVTCFALAVLLVSTVSADAGTTLVSDTRVVSISSSFSLETKDTTNLSLDEIYVSGEELSQSETAAFGQAFDAQLNSLRTSPEGILINDASASQVSTIDLSTPGQFKLDASLSSVSNNALNIDVGDYSVVASSSRVFNELDLVLRLTETTEVSISGFYHQVEGPQPSARLFAFGQDFGPSLAIGGGSVVEFETTLVVEPGDYFVSSKTVAALTLMLETEEARAGFTITGRELTGPNAVPTPAALPAGLLLMSMLGLRRRRAA